MKFLALVFSWFLLFVSSAVADDAALFKAMQKMADAGHAEAQYHLGMMYNNGIGTTQDTKQAFAWFEKATAGQDALGAYKLGCYYDGQGEGVVMRDEALALKYKLVAAEAGYSLAQYDVALLYAKQGKFDEAVQWLARASEQGFDMALYGMASAHHDGKGATQDDVRAYAFLKLSHVFSERGVDTAAQAELDRVAGGLSPEDLKRAEQFVTAFKPVPSALTLKAKQGMRAAEALVQDVSE